RRSRRSGRRTGSRTCGTAPPGARRRSASASPASHTEGEESMTAKGRGLNPTDGRCPFVKNDGGRRRSGFGRGKTGDCVVRAIAIATRKPYREVHDALTLAAGPHAAAGASAYARLVRRHGRVRHFHADHGVADEVYGPYLADLGWRFTSAKGKRVHLRADELPRGRLIVLLPRHLVAV